MKKYAFSGGLFLLCLAVGVGFVWGIGALAVPRQVDCRADCHPYTPILVPLVKEGNGVAVKFKEFVEKDGAIVVDFEITNYTDEAYIYRAYTMNREDLLVYSLAFIKVDGKEIDQWHCGTGLSNYELKPGETRVFRQNGGLSYHWKRGKSLEVGFAFKKASTDKFETFWSGNLPVDKTMEKKLSIEKRKWAD